MAIPSITINTKSLFLQETKILETINRIKRALPNIKDPDTKEQKENRLKRKREELSEIQESINTSRRAK